MSKQADEDKTLASQPPDATVDLRRQSRAFARKTEQSKSAPATEGDAETTVIEPGDEVDHFKVQRLLGRGGMGEVHLARDMKLGRKVALKLIHRRALGNTVDAVQRFLLEARMTAKFSHPNIITVYAVGEHEGVPYLALEYLRGQTLRDRMGGERYSPRETARIGLAIAQALAEAHRHRVLHRDLKPDNVLVPPDGRLRVVDFGLARQNEGSPAISERAPLSDRAPLSEPPGSEADVPVMPDVSDEGMVGTPRYMAPEQWAGADLTAVVDIWALGLILYELASGEHPYEGMGLEELCFAVYDSDPVPPMTNSTSLPRVLVELIMRCIAKPVGSRPSARDVVEQLNSFLHFGRERLNEGESPFRGLQAFTEQHANAFFGRKAESDRFVEQLRHHAMLTIVGLSGAGKSSLVRAGVIPRLRDEERWLVLRMRPGSQPFKLLAHKLIAAKYDTISSSANHGRDSVDPLLEMPPIDEAAASALPAELEREPGRLGLELRALAAHHDAKVLLFVDQVEELVTLTNDETLRTSFMAALCRAADEPLDPVRVIMTVRDDFLSRLTMEAEVHQALGSVFIIQRPGSEALEATLRNPVVAAGYAYDDPELPTEMVKAVGHEPACLPLLQFAAQQLWERRDHENKLLLRAAYEAMGGVEGALAKRADGTLAALSVKELSSARQLLLRLVTSERTRKVAEETALLEGLGEEAARVLERLTEARLVTKRKQLAGTERLMVTAELAHESLINRWDTLRRWLDEGEDELVFWAEAGQAAELWEKRGRRDEELWQGEALSDAQRMLDKSSQAVPERIQRFIKVANRKETRRVRVRRMAFAAVVASLALVVVALSFQNYRVEQKHVEAQFQRTRAEQKQAEALAEGARAAWGHGNLLETRAKVRLALEAADASAARALWWQTRDEAEVWSHRFGALMYAVQFSPDGRSLAAASQDGSVYLLDVATHEVRVLRGHTDQVFSLAFSRDGKVLASGDWSGAIRIWDPHSGQEQRILRGHEGPVSAVSFSPDGKVLVSASWDKTWRLWNVHAGDELRKVSATTSVDTAIFSPDGTLVATTDNNVIKLWSPKTGELVRTLSDPKGNVRAFSFSADGNLLASGGAGSTLRLWNARTGKLVRSFTGHSGTIRGIMFSPDGERLVSGAGDKTLKIWNAHTGEEVRTLRGHNAGLLAAAFHPSGHLVASGSRDTTVRLWDYRRRPEARQISGHTVAADGIAFSPDGRLLAAGSWSNEVRIWDTRSGDVKRVLKGSSILCHEVSFGPEGKTLASIGGNNSVQIWDVNSGKEIRSIYGHKAHVRGLNIGPDGTLATGSFDFTVRLFGGKSWKEQRAFTHSGAVTAVTLASAGDLLAASSWDNSIRIWKTDTAAPPVVLSGHTASAIGVRFSPDGQRLVSGSYDKTARIWDTRTGEQQLMLRLPARAYYVDFHPDGRRVGIPCADGVARIWDTEQQRVVNELRGHSAEVNYVRFSSDGKFAATSSDDSTVRLWDADTGNPVWRAPLMLPQPPRLLSHRGWVDLRAPGMADSKSGGHKRTETKSVADTAWAAAVAKRARFAATTPAGKGLCLQTYDGEIEMWALDTDQQKRKLQTRNAVGVRAVSTGCLVHTTTEGKSRAVLLPHEGAPKTLATHGTVTALGSSDDELFVAAGQQLFVFNLSGEETLRLLASVGITAVARLTTDWLAVGYANGNVELLRSQETSATTASATPNQSLERTPASGVTRIIPGPMGTLIAGYGNGFVGMWSMRDGKLLADGHIHGPIEHLLLEDHGLYAASSLGQHLVWDLSTFYVERCTLLREVWQRVPVVWQEGRAVAATPPANHPCAEPGAQQ